MNVTVWPATDADSPGRGETRLGCSLAGRQGHGDEHHAEVDDHAAVGPAHETPPALTPGGQHELPEAAPAAKPASPKATSGTMP